MAEVKYFEYGDKEIKYLSERDPVLGEAIKEIGASVGKTTVYRHMKMLEAKGIVRKYPAHGSESACFEYIEKEEKHKSLYHLKCSGCGKIFHAKGEALGKLKDEVAKLYGFELDKSETLLVGKCEKCRKGTE